MNRMDVLGIDVGTFSFVRQNYLVLFQFMVLAQFHHSLKWSKCRSFAKAQDRMKNIFLLFGYKGRGIQPRLHFPIFLSDTEALPLSI